MDQALKKINTFAELQEQKNKLKAEIRFSRDQLLQSLDGTRTSVQNVFVKRVALPAGIAGLAVAGVKVAQSLRHDHEDDADYDAAYSHREENSPLGILNTVQQNLAASSKWYIRLIPIAVQLVQRYMANRQSQQYSYSHRYVEDAQLYPSESAAALPVGSR